MRKDYYLILGVSRTESMVGIRTAYRRLAKRHHPDCAGRESTRCFQEITEAYSVLSDPEKRESYNEELRRAEEREKNRPAPTRVRSRMQPGRHARDPMSAVRGFQSARSFFDGRFESFFGDFIHTAMPGGEPSGGFKVEVILSSQEASQGGLLPLRIPVSRVCPFCRGSSRFWPFSCSYCHGRGMVEAEEILPLRIPSQVRDGTVLEVPVRGFGNRPFSLFIHIRVGKEDL